MKLACTFACTTCCPRATGPLLARATVLEESCGVAAVAGIALELVSWKVSRGPRRTSNACSSQAII